MGQDHIVARWPEPNEEDTPAPSSDVLSKGFWLEVLLPLASVLINMPSICGGRLFGLDGDLTSFRFLILGCGLLGCAVRAISLIDRDPSARWLGWLAGALLIAACGSSVGLLFMLPRMLELLAAIRLIFPILMLVMGMFPYVGVVRWCMAISKFSKLVDSQMFWRAFKQAAVATAVLLIGLHVFFAALIGHAKQTLAQGDVGAAPSALVVLQAAAWENDQSVKFVQQAWYDSVDPARKQVLGDAYHTLTGKEIGVGSPMSGCW